jgi:multicomponent Na+:H+ antiporter subunit B
MKSVILATATRYLMPMLLLLSAFLLFRGHNLPGGGFIGGLVASATFILHSFAFGVDKTQALLRVSPQTLIAGGLLTAVGSGLLALFNGQAFMTASWGALPPGDPQGLHIGTPVIFDIGVYLVVIGAVLTIILALAQEED